MLSRIQALPAAALLLCVAASPGHAQRVGESEQIPVGTPAGVRK